MKKEDMQLVIDQHKDELLMLESQIKEDERMIMHLSIAIFIVSFIAMVSMGLLIKAILNFYGV